MRLVRSLAVLSCAFTLLACSSTPNVPESTPPEAFVATEAAYSIGVDDVLRVDVWNKPDLSVTVPVRPDGKISVPLVGDLVVGGKTPEDVSTDLANALSEYIKDPVVAVILTEINSHEYLSRVRVTGAVREPVSLSFRKGMTVLDVILAAGGVTEFAVAERSTLYRKTGDGVKSYPVYLGTILNRGDLTTNYDLHPGDIVTVPERVF